MDQHLQDRIENWRRHVTGRVGPAGSVIGSAERMYRPDRLAEGEEDERRKPRVPIDAEDAERVESAWRLVHPRIDRQFLRLVYIKAWPAGKVLRILGRRNADFRAWRYRATTLLQSELANVDALRYKLRYSVQKDVPTSEPEGAVSSQEAA